MQTPGALHVWRLDVLLRQRRWTSRLPHLLGTVRRVRAAVATAAALAALTLLLVVATTLSRSAAGTRETLVDAATATVLLVALLRGLTGPDPQPAISAYESQDLGLLTGAGTTTRDLVVARVVLRTLVLDTTALVVVGLPVVVAAGLVGAGPALATPFLLAMVVWVAAGALGNAVGAVLLHAALRARPVLVLPLAALSGAVVPAVLVAALVLVAPGLVQSVGDATSFPDLVRSLLDRPDVASALAVLHDPQGAPAVLVGACAVVAASVTVAGRTAPTDARAAQRLLAHGTAWRLDAPFPRSVVLTSIDKDLRLLMRRGWPAWQVLDDAVRSVPFVAGLGLASSAVVVGVGGDAPAVQQLGVLTNACLVIAVMTLTSEALQPFLSLDTDGPVVSALRDHEKAFARYLGARSASGAGALSVVLACYLLVVDAIAPWPGLTVLVVAAGGTVAAAAEAVVVVVGSALRPALYRPAIGLADLEPVVRLCSGLVLAAVVVGVCPLVLLAARAPEPPAAAPLVVVALLLTTLAGPLAATVAPTVHRRLSRRAAGRPPSSEHQTSSGEEGTRDGAPAAV